jgi:hypothetical protein
MVIYMRVKQDLHHLPNSAANPLTTVRNSPAIDPPTLVPKSLIYNRFLRPSGWVSGAEPNILPELRENSPGVVMAELAERV